MQLSSPLEDVVRKRYLVGLKERVPEEEKRLGVVEVLV
jgi:hypothetical protein